LNMSDAEADKVVGVIVTVDDQHLPEIESVAGALRSAGMQVERVMPTIGIITGKVSDDKRQDLTRIAGVASVEIEGEMYAI
jgi:hypothetical protein